MNLNRLFMLFCFLNVGCFCTYGADHKNDTIYVSSVGSDLRGDGTERAPFCTLNRAVQGQLSQTGSDTLFVLVASGDYYMKQPFSIQAPSSRPIVIKSQGNEKPRFLGGIQITGWEKEKEGVYRAYIPEVIQYGFEFEQFYVNGKRAVLARTPNREWFFVKNSNQYPFAKTSTAALADYAVQRFDFYPEDWTSLSGLSKEDLANMKFRFYHKWDITRKSPEYVVTDSACVYMEGGGMKPWNPIQKGSRYFMYDYKAALDSVGEWYLDRESGYIYYMPVEGEVMEDAFCVVPILHQWIDIQGKQSAPVRNLKFENLSFQYASYMIPKEGEEPTQAAANTEAAVELDYVEHVTFANCEFLHTGAYAIWIGEECHNNAVRHCYIADLGAGGIKVGRPVWDASKNTVTSGNIIDNNIITSAGHEQPCGVGVALFHTADNQVTHNEISDILYSGVSVGWTWGYNEDGKRSPAVRNIVQYNHIHHIGWGELSDMGAVYTLGESPGTDVSYNVIHDVYSYDYGGWGLYTDEGSTDVVMSNNLVYRCKSGGFHQHYGKNNRIKNNILALAYTHQLQCTRAEKHRSFTFQHNIVLIDNEDLFKRNWEKADINADYNLYWSLSGKMDFCEKTFKEWKKEKEPHSIWKDPKFMDPREGDFRLQTSSAVKKIGFKPFDYSKAGVYGESEWKQKARLSTQRENEFKRIVDLSIQKYGLQAE